MTERSGEETVFRNKPVPSDWELPEDIKAVLDPVRAAIYSEHAIDDVPIPLTIRFSTEMYKSVTELDAGLLTARGVAEIVTQRTAQEQERYPDSSLWDRARENISDMLLERGHDEEAYLLAWAIGSPHRLAERLIKINETTGGQRWADTHQRMVGLEVDRKIKLIRAFRDVFIDKDPMSETVGVFNAYLAALGAESDPVEGWIESQRSDRPEYPWDGVIETIRDEQHWSGVPVPMRQHLMFVGMEFWEDISQVSPGSGPLHEQWADSACEYLDGMEDSYPDAKIFGHLRGNLSMLLLKADQAQAVRMAGSIREPRLIAGVVEEFINEGYEEAAVGLASVIADPRITVELLLDDMWKGSVAPLIRLEEILLGDEFPAEKRIGCLEVMRDIHIHSGLADRARWFQQIIDELREGRA
jgi:hypothetical protein